MAEPHTSVGTQVKTKSRSKSNRVQRYRAIVTAKTNLSCTQRQTIECVSQNTSEKSTNNT